MERPQLLLDIYDCYFKFEKAVMQAVHLTMLWLKKPQTLDKALDVVQRWRQGPVHAKH